jgi:ATP-dependent DNA ligase
VRSAAWNLFNKADSRSLALLRSWPTNLSAVLCAFNLFEVDGEDLRRLPIEQRKRTLVKHRNEFHFACRIEIS